KIFWYIIVIKQTYSDTSTGNKIGVYKFLEDLGLLDNEVVPVNMNDDDNSKFDIDKEDNYQRCFGKDALKKLYQAREACQHFILLRLFTMYLPNLSEQAKNGLFVAFFRSNSFGVLEHNALLDALAYLVKGLNLFKYDKLGLNHIQLTWIRHNYFLSIPQIFKFLHFDNTVLEHVSLMCYLVDEAT
ncbi:2878_t:CDS:2, partial [Gigaspora margarita]